MFGVLLAIVTVKGINRGFVIQLTFDKLHYMGMCAVSLSILSRVCCWVCWFACGLLSMNSKLTNQNWQKYLCACAYAWVTRGMGICVCNVAIFLLE